MSEGDEPGGRPATGNVASPQLPTVDALLRVIANQTDVDPEKVERRYVRHFRTRSVESQEKYAHLKGLQDHYRHKGYWSYFLMLVMAVMIGFQSYLLFQVGIGAWDFTKYDWLLPLLLAQNLAQVVGLAVFVVKALFKDIK